MRLPTGFFSPCLYVVYEFSMSFSFLEKKFLFKSALSYIKFNSLPNSQLDLSCKYRETDFFQEKITLFTKRKVKTKNKTSYNLNSH